MRNPLARCWRYLFHRPLAARYVPELPPFEDSKPEPPPAPKQQHPMRRKTDRWPRQG